MNRKERCEIVLRVSHRGHVLARLLAVLALGALAPGAARVSSAQSPEKAAPIAAKPPAAQKSALAYSTDKGLNTAIKVHGHWVIEVRNPDGKLVTRREFDNSLSPGFPVPTVGQAPGGGAFLSALLTGQAVSPVSWGIYLEGPNGLGSGTNAPCVVTALTISPGACLILQNSSNSSYANFVCNATGQPAGTSCNLTASPVGTAPNFTGFELAGSVIATQSGSINFVATGDFGLCGASAQPAPNCAFTVSEGGYIAVFTGRSLDGNTTAGNPNPVPVTTGQTIAVTVNISFQ